MFGLSIQPSQTAGSILKILASEWRDLVAGREGFLVSPNRAGLLRHGVVWGEMDSMGHVNNVMYVRYAESARVNWALNYGIHVDPEHKREWSELASPRGVGMILKSIGVEYKFVRISISSPFPCARFSPSLFECELMRKSQ
jgi:hypothetical protein